jgi:cellobiose phosphorylase
MSVHESAAFLSIESDYAHEFVMMSNMILGNHEFDHRGHIDIYAQTATVKLTPHDDTDVKKMYPDAVFYVTTSETEKVKHICTDEWLFADGQSRGLPYVTIRTKRVHTFSLVVTGSVLQTQYAETLCRKYQTQSVDFGQDQQDAWSFWQTDSKSPKLALHREHQLIEKLNDIFYWYLHNGIIHCTTPYGLEQYTGAAWGVRDVCQGPVELLLATRNYTTIKDILLTVFSHQYEETADWPQWFMFDRFVHIQHPESHGDIIVWPLKALALYLEATNDLSILEVKIPYTDQHTFAFTPQESTLLQHIQYAIDAIEARFISGTALSSYGGGDWNDTLQPADAAMHERMASAWTVSLTYQVFQQLAQAFQRAGLDHERNRMRHLAQRMKDDFQHYLIQDRVVSGFSYFHEDGHVEHIIHPSDERTGIQYRLLPMTRSMISELFSPAQTQDHLRLIDAHLTFPDGVRLMNKPVPYRGGVRVFFRRAEESAYFGREIGLQYIHAHIRYLEAMCKTGQSIKAYDAVCRILPIGIQDDVPNAQVRQSNAYFSSSDADVRDRYEAEVLFNRLREGRLSVKGGWRIYSSGPGIFINQIIANFLGLRDYYEYVVIDPVLPKSLNGLRFAFAADERSVTHVFAIGRDESAAVQSVRINGRDVAFIRQENPYRLGGAMIERSAFQALLHGEDNIVSISVG